MGCVLYVGGSSALDFTGGGYLKTVFRYSLHSSHSASFSSVTQPVSYPRSSFVHHALYSLEIVTKGNFCIPIFKEQAVVLFLKLLPKLLAILDKP
jgi:hypothetical protein